MRTEKSKNAIETVVKLLQVQKKDHLADLLKGSQSIVNESNEYVNGGPLYARASTFEIYSSPINYNELKQLPPVDQQTILNAVQSIYPAKEDAPYIMDVVYIPDAEIELDRTSKIEDLLIQLKEFIPSKTQLIYGYEDRGKNAGTSSRYPQKLLIFQHYPQTDRATPAVALHIKDKENKRIEKSYCFDNIFSLYQLAQETLKALQWLESQELK